MRSTAAWFAQVLSQYAHRLPWSRSKSSDMIALWPLAIVATRWNAPLPL